MNCMLTYSYVSRFDSCQLCVYCQVFQLFIINYQLRIYVLCLCVLESRRKFDLHKQRPTINSNICWTVKSRWISINSQMGSKLFSIVIKIAWNTVIIPNYRESFARFELEYRKIKVFLMDSVNFNWPDWKNEFLANFCFPQVLCYIVQNLHACEFRVTKYVHIAYAFALHIYAYIYIKWMCVCVRA